MAAAIGDEEPMHVAAWEKNRDQKSEETREPPRVATVGGATREQWQ